MASESVKTVIAHFNKVTGRSLRFKNINNVRIVEDCLDDDESNIVEIKNHALLIVFQLSLSLKNQIQKKLPIFLKL